MGLWDSPYHSLQWQARLKLEVYTNRWLRANYTFHWDRVVFNLPWSRGYRADLPWVIKVRWDGELAAKVFVYIDEGRPTGPTKFLTRLHQEGSTGRVKEADSPLPYAGTLGWDSNLHGWGPDMRDGVPGKVGED
jgi:hypothetical protein